MYQYTAFLYKYTRKRHNERILLTSVTVTLQIISERQKNLSVSFTNLSVSFSADRLSCNEDVAIPPSTTHFIFLFGHLQIVKRIRHA